MLHSRQKRIKYAAKQVGADGAGIINRIQNGGASMARGGNRSGAGRPHGGISELSRILQDGGVDGLAALGAEKGIEGDREARAQGAVSLIVQDMARAGRGDDVIRFLAALTASKAKAEDTGGGSLLLEALRKQPNLLPNGTITPPIDGEYTEIPIKSTHNNQVAADLKSAASVIDPYFDRQFKLGLD